jgi:hypothetical protein
MTGDSPCWQSFSEIFIIQLLYFALRPMEKLAQAGIISAIVFGAITATVQVLAYFHQGPVLLASFPPSRPAEFYLVNGILIGAGITGAIIGYFFEVKRKPKKY